MCPETLQSRPEPQTRNLNSRRFTVGLRPFGGPSDAVLSFGLVFWRLRNLKRTNLLAAMRQSAYAPQHPKPKSKNPENPENTETL